MGTITYEWHEGVVDQGREHIVVSWGPEAAEPEGVVAVALVAPTDKPGHFVVEFVLDASAPNAATALADVRRELDFYLVEKEEPYPWAYARYHCSTAANIYGHVHWSLQRP